jgi:hypothetical protein
MTDPDLPPIKHTWFFTRAALLRERGGKDNLDEAVFLEGLGRHFEHGVEGSCDRCLPGTPGWRSPNRETASENENGLV